ncbi:hypothetical protein KY310_00765 [Candidatus Woesearchaeota archaeon]|nr:hypothetical protein [Candidatus Woesearchaeota archaeon]
MQKLDLPDLKYGDQISVIYWNGLREHLEIPLPRYMQDAGFFIEHIDSKDSPDNTDTIDLARRNPALICELEDLPAFDAFVNDPHYPDYKVRARKLLLGAEKYALPLIVAISLQPGSQNEQDVLNLFTTPLDDLVSLGAKTNQSLRRKFFHTIGELLQMTEEDFLKCGGFGKKGLAKLKTQLARHGLKLRESEMHWYKKERLWAAEYAEIADPAKLKQLSDFFCDGVYGTASVELDSNGNRIEH